MFGFSFFQGALRGNYGPRRFFLSLFPSFLPSILPSIAHGPEGPPEGACSTESCMRRCTFASGQSVDPSQYSHESASSTCVSTAGC